MDEMFSRAKTQDYINEFGTHIFPVHLAMSDYPVYRSGGLVAVDASEAGSVSSTVIRHLAILQSQDIKKKTDKSLHNIQLAHSEYHLGPDIAVISPFPTQCEHKI